MRFAGTNGTSQAISTRRRQYRRDQQRRKACKYAQQECPDGDGPYGYDPGNQHPAD